MKSTILLFLLLTTALTCSIAAQDQPPAKEGAKAREAQKDEAKPRGPVLDSDEDLRAAIQSARGNDQAFLDNIDEYLKKYPNSMHRADLEREMYRLAARTRDTNRMITYASRLVERNANDVDMLTGLIELLRERHAEGDLQKALKYANQLVEEFENIFSRDKPARVSPAQWEDRRTRGVASVYMIRGRVQVDLKNNEKAQADLLKSYKLSRFSEAAVALAELAAQRKAADEAIDYYAQAFAISIEEKEGADRDEIRERLGKLYIARRGSDAGLGDLILKTWDAHVKEEAARRERVTGRNINEGVTDAFQFKLTRLDGTTLNMQQYRGKVLIINFWATWCGPCRYEMPMLEKAMVKYAKDPDVVFLALSTDEDRTLVAPYLKEQKYKLPVAYAESLEDLFGVNSIPTTIIFDKKGAVAWRQAGIVQGEDFVALLSEKIEMARGK
ncbi:MAG: redoxin family protein [Blastocatellia bacterium]